MSQSFQLKAIITGVDRLSPLLGKMSKAAQKNMKSIASAGQRVGLALAAGITATSVAFADQENATMGLKTAMMDASGSVGPEFQKMADLATSLGNKLPGTTADFENMMEMLVRQGIPAQNILNGVGDAAAYMAVQMHLGPSEAAEKIAQLQDATKTLSKDMLELADATQRAYYMGVELGDSVEFYGKASPVLGLVSKVGVKSAEMFEPFNVMLNQAGMQGGAAGNATRKFMQGMMDRKKMKKASRAGHVSMRFTEHGEFSGIENMYSQLAKLKPLSSEKRMAALKAGWGDDAETLQALNTIIDKGVEGYKEIQRRMEAQASLNQRVKASLNTLTNMWDAMTGTATNAAAAIGEVFAPEIKMATEKINDFSEKIGKYVKENPKTVETIAAMALAIAGVSLAIKGVNAALVLLDANPVVAGILALAAAAAFLVVNWDEVKKTAGQMWEEIKGIFGKIGRVFKDMAIHAVEWGKSLTEPIVKAFQEMWEKIKDHTPDFVLKFLADDETGNTKPPILPVPPIIPPNPVSRPQYGEIPPRPDYNNSPQNGKSEVTVKIEGAPPGTRVSEPKSTGPIKMTTEVGYSSYSSQYTAAMTGQ